MVASPGFEPAIERQGSHNWGKRPGVARRSGVDGFWRPVPRQEIIETVHGMAVDHALEHVFKVGVGLDVVELCRGDEGADRGPSLSAAIGPGKEMVLAPERHGPDGALDGVVVEFDAAIVEESAQRRAGRIDSLLFP